MRQRAISIGETSWCADLSLASVEDAIAELAKRGDYAISLIVPQVDLADAHECVSKYGLGLIALPAPMITAETHAVAGSQHVIWFRPAEAA